MSRSHAADARHAVEAGRARAQREQAKNSRAAEPGKAVPRSNQAIASALGAGTPLEADVRADMEQRFGTSFADVRVHDDEPAHRSAGELEAKAYTQGSDIAFGAGRYEPRAPAGRRLLAHELAHVVQQRRGGAAPELAKGAPHEAGAEQAAAQVAAGASSVAVAGATGVGVARDSDDDKHGDAEKAERRAKRAGDKARDKLRGEERTEARGGAQQSLDSKAKAQLDSMMAQAKRGDFVRSSPDEKLESLHRFKAALKDAQMSQLAKNKLQGQYDELLRTPRSNLSGDPQSKWVAGGEATPGMDLPAGRSSYAQPEHSRYYGRGDAAKRYHVNLKSDTLDGLKPGEARSKGREYAKQAQRNSRHLPDEEGIVLDFAEPGTPAVRDAICEGAFVKDGAIQEIRFHTRTITRAAWEAEMGVGPPLDVDARAKKERLSKEKREARELKAKEDAAAKEAKAKAKAAPKEAKGSADAAPKEPAAKKSAAKTETPRKRPAAKKSKAPKKKPAAKKAKSPKAKSAEAKAKEAEAKAKAAKAKGAETQPKAPEAKPAEAPKQESAGSKPEVKPAQAASEATAPKEAPVAPKVEPVAPKVEPVKPSVPVETPGGVTPKEMAGGALAAAGILAGVSGVKDIVKDFKEGHPWRATGKAGLLGLSFVPEAAPPLFAFGAIMNYWGPRHEKIESDAFAVGDFYSDLAGDVPLLGRSETFRSVVGGIGAANQAVWESVGYTLEDMGDAVVDGAETLGGLAEDAYDWLTEGPSIMDVVREQVMKQQAEE